MNPVEQLNFVREIIHVCIDHAVKAALDRRPFGFARSFGQLYRYRRPDARRGAGVRGGTVLGVGEVPVHNVLHPLAEPIHR